MRTKKGIVGSTKMTDTVSVTVDRFLFHPIYKKRFKRSKKFLADTNGHTIHEGDTVEITECSPMSKRKYFKVTSIITSAAIVSDMDDSQDEKLAKSREKAADTSTPDSTKDIPESDSPAQA